MVSTLRFSELSSARQAIVRLCQATNFGHIHDLTVRDGEPFLTDVSPTLIADIRLDIEDPAREELAVDDFVVCAEVLRLMALFDKIENGKISKIEVRAGVPRRITWERKSPEVMEVLVVQDLKLQQLLAARQAGSRESSTSRLG